MHFFIHDIIYDEDHYELMIFLEDIGNQIIQIHDFLQYFYVVATDEVKDFLEHRSRGVRYELVTDWKMLFGYHPEPTPVYKISCVRRQQLFWTQSAIKKEISNCEFIEHYVDPVLRFIQHTNHTIGKWYEWLQGSFIPDQITTDTFINHCPATDIKLHDKFMSYPNQLVVMSFDLETSGLLATRGDTIHTIGMTFHSEQRQKRVCLHLFTAEKPEDDFKSEEDDPTPIEFIACRTEKELLYNFQRVVRQEKVSVIIGFNTSGFDWDFLFQRAEFLQLSSEFYQWSWWYPMRNVERFETNVRTGGDRSTFQIPGIHCQDIYLLAKERMKLDSYSLNSVAAYALGKNAPKAQKDQLPIQDITSCALPTCSSHVRYYVGKYCIQDCSLVWRIVHTHDYINFIYKMASLCFITPRICIYKGVSHKINSLLMYHCLRQQRLFNVPPFQEAKVNETETEEENENIIDHDRFLGGYVFPPKTGLRKHLLKCDYASLYPSIIIHYQLCMSLLLTPEQAATFPDSEIRKIITDEEKDPEGSIVYVKIPTAADGPPIVPIIEEGLYSERAYWKKMMKSYAVDSPGYKCCNANQLAVKLIMNGIYGAISIICRAIGKCVTRYGRETIQKSAEIVKDVFKGTVIYGDTDSLMFQIDEVKSFATIADRTNAFECMQRIADYITNYWLERANPPRQIPVKVFDCESICHIFISGKKTYALHEYMSPQQEKPKFTVKGLAPTKRDTPTFVRQAIIQLLDKLIEEDYRTCYLITKGAIDYVQDHCGRPLQSKEVVNKFILTSSLSKYEFDTPTPAISLEYRRRSRVRTQEVSSSYHLLDRISFVAVKSDTRADVRYHFIRTYGMLPIGGEIMINSKYRAQIPAPDPSDDYSQTICFECPKLTFTIGCGSNASKYHRYCYLSLTGYKSWTATDRVYLDGIRAFEYRPDTQLFTFRVTCDSNIFLVEDPDFVNTQDQQLDYQFYIKKLKSPLKLIVTTLLKSATVSSAYINQIKLLYENAEKGQKKRQQTVSSFFIHQPQTKRIKVEKNVEGGVRTG